jgi:hypothetical protein
VDVTRKVLVAEAWCPVSAKPRVHEALREAAHSTSASVRARAGGRSLCLSPLPAG